MAKIIPRKEQTDKAVVMVKTSTKKSSVQGKRWWLAENDKEMAEQLLETASFLKEQQQYRYRQAGVYARLYGNMPLYQVAGSSLNKMSTNLSLPIDRPTMNVVQSCIDTLVSRVTQSRPRPVFLTDNSDYKQRNLAKQLNHFIDGELYQTKAYAQGELLLRDAAALGTGVLKIYEDSNKKVALDRVLYTELLVDPNDALYGSPRQLYQFKLVDRSMLQAAFPKYRSDIEKAEQAFPDNSADASRTVSDQVMVVEGWRLPSSKDAGDGKHVLACTSGVISEEEWTKDNFPFVFLHYSPRLLGFWGQGLAEQLMGTQVEINKLLMTISQAINLVGVPRVFVEAGSKVVKSHFNNNVGSIVEFRGTKPIYEVAPCMPAEVYAQLQRLVQFAFQQSGVSALAATAQKPAGLNSGEALRNYDDLQSDRFAALVRRYDNVFIELAYQITGLAREIAERDGKYQTIYPNKNGTKEIDLPASKMLDNPFVIQCFDASSLPRDPAGRKQYVIEMMQSGVFSMKEGRRLLQFPDLEQEDRLANASEERILQVLDRIVDEGKYTPPDPFMDLQLANELCTQYYNLYVSAKLEEDREAMLRTFSTQVQTLMEMGTPAAPIGQGASPQAVPQASPVSDMLPNGAVQ